MVFCFICRHFTVNTNLKIDSTFINKGFNCWRKQTESFNKHMSSEKHKLNNEKYVMFLNIKKNDTSVANSLITSRKKYIEENRKHIILLLKATLFLSKQGLPFRGHDESNESTNRGNFIELLNTFTDPETITKLSARYGHYTSPEYQNDLIKTIASSTRKNIIEKIAFTGAYSILVDETKDASKKEQLSFIIRFVDGNLNIHEKAIGCYHMKKCDAYTLSQEILNIAAHNKLDIQKCVAQCYDGASVMSGLFSGVQKRIVDIVPHAIYIHCHAHRLNLCLVNTIQNNNIVVDFFDTVQSLYKYLMNGHTRYELFMKIQRDKKLKEIHLERLVETRWSYWHSSLKKIQIRYSEIKDVLKVLTVQDDQAARAIGLLEEISTFRFILILYIMEQILSTIHCVSCQLQCSTILLPKAINLVTSTKNQLINLRSEENFTYIYNEAKICAIKNQVTVEKEEERNIRLRKKYEPSKKFEDFFIMSTLGQTGTKQAKHNGENVKTDVLFNVIDR